MSRGMKRAIKSAGKPSMTADIPGFKQPCVDVPGRQIVAFSGGKDSWAMASKMAENGEEFALFFTPAGNEFPEILRFIEDAAKAIGKKLIVATNGDLQTWVEKQSFLPNPRSRWCTRILKIIPCQVFLKTHPGLTLCVGLRADEEQREGLYGSEATYRYPLREWGWGLADVLAQVESTGMPVHKRTDCALCPYQRLGEWHSLWKNRPDEFAKGEAMEKLVSDARGKHCTFRSPSRDTWPAGLADLRAEFEGGRMPRRFKADGDDPAACRVCRI